MKINTVSPAFRGYKNVLAYDYAKTPQSGFSILSFELNDEDGYKDLTEYKRLRKIYNKNYNNMPNQHLVTCIYTKDRELEHLTMNTLPLLSEKTLKNLTNNGFQRAERVQLKANTLLASITRRMMQNGLSIIDSGFGNVIKNTMAALLMSGLNKPDAFHIVETACLNNQPSDKIGALLNDYIQRKMIKYFK